MLDFHKYNSLACLNPEGKAIRERVRAALLNSGFTVPDRRITINLSPADLPTDHPGYDLPIALALLAASNQLPEPLTKQ